MKMPNNISLGDQITLKKLLDTVQQVMHQINLFIKDFNQILEMPDEDLCGEKVVISSAVKPTDVNAKVNNILQNLQN